MSTNTSAIRWSAGSWPSAAVTSRAVSVSISGAAMSTSGSSVVGRAWARRTRSRHALTTIRCSQVVTAESPRNRSAARNAEISASCTASAASSRSPNVRSATAHSRSRCRRTSAAKASGSPATWARSSSTSLFDPSSATAVLCGQIAEPARPYGRRRGYAARPGQLPLTVISSTATWYFPSPTGGSFVIQMSTYRVVTPSGSTCDGPALIGPATVLYVLLI